MAARRVKIKRSKFYKANGPTARLEAAGFKCSAEGCRRARFRRGLCTSHFKRLQRKKKVEGPIEEHVVAELHAWQHQVGDTLTLSERALQSGGLWVETPAEASDDIYQYRKRNFLRDAARWLESLGWVPPHNRAQKLARA